MREPGYYWVRHSSYSDWEVGMWTPADDDFPGRWYIGGDGPYWDDESGRAITEIDERRIVRGEPVEEAECFRRGAQAMRELIVRNDLYSARERGLTAHSWNSLWGNDPGRPTEAEYTEMMGAMP